MNKSYIKVVYFIAFASIVIAGFLQFESVSDNSLGALLLIMPLSMLYLLRGNNSNSSISSNLNIAMPIMNKYSLTKQKSISIIIGAKDSGKSSILKNNNYSLIPENKLNGPRVGSWWQLENDMFFEIDVDEDFNPEFPDEDDNCWETLLQKLQKQLLPYHLIKSVIIVFPVNILHQSNAPLKSYLSNTKKLLTALHSYSTNTKLNIIFSHCESIQGFQSFFYGLESDAKSQLLTLNKTHHENKLSLANMFTPKFIKIIASLQQQMFSRLRQEHDLAKKIEIKDFPLQLEALIKPIKELLMTIEITSPNQTQGIYFCSNFTNNNTYDFIQNGDPISTTKQQIVLINNKEKHHCYFNANIITNINDNICTKAYDKKDFIIAGTLTAFSIASIILFKQSYESYSMTNNITSTVESMIAIKANNNNSEIDRLYLALKYLSDNQNIKNSNSQTEELRARLREHYNKQLNITLSKEISNKINQYFATRLEHDESFFPQYINTKLIFINEPVTKKREWLQQLLKNSSHHKYLNQHITNLFKTEGDSIEFPVDIQTKVTQKLQGFSVAEKVMMLVNKPRNKVEAHLGFPNETILSIKSIKQVITEQIPTACSKLILSKELKESEQQSCAHASIKHYLVDYMNLWLYENEPPQIKHYDSLSELNSDLSSLLKNSSNLEKNLAATEAAMNTLNDYEDPKLKADIITYNNSIKAISSWTKLLEDKNLKKTLDSIIKIKPDYEKYYAATVEYYNNDKLSQLRKLEQMAESQPQEQREWLNNITSQTLKFYEQKAYTYLDNIWQQTVYNIYQKKILNKFPVSPSSNTEMSISDFEQFFSTDGIFQTYLSLVEPLIDTNIISKTNRAAFLLARRIANSWFVNNKLTVKLTLIPIDLTTNANNFYLEVGQNKLSFDKNNLKSTTISWPSGNDDLVTMEFTNKAGQSTIMNKNSPWALFQVLQEADIKPLMAKNQAYVTFKKDAFAAKYQTITEDGFNIKDIAQISQFNINEHL